MIKLQRRQFLELALLTGASVSFGWPNNSRANKRKGTLIWLELRGGNDGLNTVIPYKDEAYKLLRPTLRIEDGIPISNELAFHPALSGLLPLWEAKQLSLALGVGWPEPNRSHFKATDQWATASQSGEGIGWLAKTMDSHNLNYPLIGLGPTGSSAMDGGNSITLQLSKADLKKNTSSFKEIDDLFHQRPLLQKLLSLEKRSLEALNQIKKELAQLPKNHDLPNNSLGNQFALALQLVGSPNPPPFIQMEHSGYDTHINQKQRHGILLRQLTASLVAFHKGLKAFPSRSAVTILITSEFGRRLAQNGSGGTDHGSASTSILIGDQLSHSIYGKYPSLKNLDNRGDLISNLAPPDLYQIAIDSTN